MWTTQLSGIASGQIGGTPFSGALVHYIGTGDTTNIVSFPTFGEANSFDKLTVSISGVGTATLTVPTEILDIPFPIIDPTGQIPAIPLIIFGRTDHPPDFSGITGMGAVGSTLLTGYDLATAIGPITDSGGIGFMVGCNTPFHDPYLQTDRGFRFTTNTLFSTEGTFTATVAPVPEPATVLLVGGGLAALVRSLRRQRD